MHLKATGMYTCSVLWCAMKCSIDYGTRMGRKSSLEGGASGEKPTGPFERVTNNGGKDETVHRARCAATGGRNDQGPSRAARRGGEDGGADRTGQQAGSP